MGASATKRRRQEPERLSYAPAAIPLPVVSKSDLGEATKRAAYYRICFMGKERSGGKNSWAAALAWAAADAGLEVGSLSRQRARQQVHPVYYGDRQAASSTGHDATSRPSMYKRGSRAGKHVKNNRSKFSSTPPFTGAIGSSSYSLPTPNVTTGRIIRCAKSPSRPPIRRR